MKIWSSNSKKKYDTNDSFPIFEKEVPGEIQGEIYGKVNDEKKETIH